MSDERFRRELNQIFDDVAGSPSSNLRDRVRSAVAAPPESRAPYWFAAVAAAVIAVLIVGVLVVGGPFKRVPSPARGVLTNSSPTPSPASSPSPAASPSPFVCTNQEFVVKPIVGATPTQGPVTFISALRTGTHGSYDRITIEFSNGSPRDVQVSPGGTTFTASPSGQEITLKGDHGIWITIREADLHSAYSGSTDIVTGYPTLAEVRRVQDFEGVVQLGVGVNGPGCYRAYFLTNPNRLVIDVEAAP